MKIILSTDNQNKLKEIRDLLPEGVELLSKSEAGFGDVHPVEDGDSLEANAKIKVDAIDADDAIIIGDDTGLFVDALDGRPGIYSARYAGDGDDEANRKKLLCELEGVNDRKAHFKTVMAIKREGRVEFVEGVAEGTILSTERGANGFGYDPLFQPEGSSKTFAEMNEEEKNSISHRGRALQALINLLDLGKNI